MGTCLKAREIKRQVELAGYEKTYAHLVENLEAKALKPNDFNIRDLAVAFMGQEWVNSLNPKSGRMPTPVELQEATGDVVASHMFNQITGQFFYATVKEGYELEDLPFTKLVPTKPVTTAAMEKIPGLSEVGDEFSVIGEADLYPNFGISQDWQERGPLQKRGGIVKVTKEAVLEDKTGLLLERCRGIGKWLAWNKEKRIIDAVVDENAGAVAAPLGGHRYHWKGTSYATFQTTTPWVNVKTSNALVDYTDVEGAWLIGTQMTDPHTGEPIVFRPKHIIVTMQNAMTAARVMRATNVQTHVGGYAVTGNLVDMHSPSPLNEFTPGVGIVTSALLASRTATDTDWWLGDIGKAVNYFERWGITPVEASPNNQEEFERDVVNQFKVSEMGLAAVVEPRALVESRA